jgi:hypothetical protein
MELTTILNRCHHFRGFVYEHARFSTDKKSIEVVLRPRKGSAAICSRCHLPAPGYNQLAERRFEFHTSVGDLRLPAVSMAAERHTAALNEELAAYAKAFGQQHSNPSNWLRVLDDLLMLVMAGGDGSLVACSLAI